MLSFITVLPYPTDSLLLDLIKGSVFISLDFKVSRLSIVVPIKRVVYAAKSIDMTVRCLRSKFNIVLT